MLKHRVIPVLLLSNGGLVKTSRFSNPKYVGDPINAIRIFNDKEVDELIVLDIAATRNCLAPDYALIEQFAGECFMPLCYGGGIATIEHAKRIFSLGVEKVCLQSSVLANTGLIRQIADRHGSQSVVASVDLKRNWRGRPKLYSAANRKTLNKPWRKHIEDVVAAGCGEVMVNAVDRDGTMKGIDVDLIRQASDGIDIPLIAAGGVGSLGHIREGVDAGASAVAVGAFFVFHGPHRAVLITYPKYEELESLFSDEAV